MKNALNSLNNNNNINLPKSVNNNYQYLVIITLMVGIIPVVLSDLSMMDQIALIFLIVIYSGLQFAQISKLQKSVDNVLMMTVVVPILIIVGVVLYVYLMKDDTL